MTEFFLHIPKTPLRKKGWIARGIQRSLLLNHPVTDGDWHELNLWISRQSQPVVLLTSYESGFPLLKLQTTKPFHQEPPSILAVVPETMEEIWEEEVLQFNNSSFPISFQPNLSQVDYINGVQSVQDHLRMGDFYEANFCTRWSAVASIPQPYETWKKVFTRNPAPFAAYLHFKNWHLLSLSPERFMCKEGTKLFSQPIKGTIKRGLSHSHDEELKRQLLNSKKDQSENVMIVDLVRNDLSKIAEKASVHVDELCGLYSFKHLHHLISTISCRIHQNLSAVDAYKALFPMGSMTGAPKRKCVETMHELEMDPRGWYSGSLAVIEPNGDWDANVIIRSILYNQEKHTCHMGIGSAITLQSNPEEEWNECNLKAQSFLAYLNSSE